jgi:alanyl-tRNA synthetase
VSGGAAAPTGRLYYTDAYRAEFTARVVDRSDDGRRVYLDSTAFYPTSGGQLNDLGTLGGVAVVDVIDEDGRIAHLLMGTLGTESPIEGRIDWKRRFDHMQQHTGQHLLSAVFEDLLGARTVSVHFGEGYSTVDLETDSLSPDQLARAERRANEIIAENRAVTVAFEESAEATGLRKAVDRGGILRVVSIDHLDRSACGGTHVRSTGEIGCALLRGTERIRKTIRVEFLCGLRAVERSRADYKALAGIAGTLSASIDDLPTLVASQATQLKEGEQARRKLERDLAGYRARSMFEQFLGGATEARVAFQEAAAQTMDQLRTLGQAVLEIDGVILVATTVEGNGLLVAATEDSGADAGKVVRESLGAVGGKGGGSPRLAQGTAPSTELATEALELIRAALAPGR